MLAMVLAHGATGSHFLDSLSEDNFNLLRPSLAVTSLDRDAPICVPGSDVNCVWFPTTAILSVVTILEDGRDLGASTRGRAQHCRHRADCPPRPGQYRADSAIGGV